MEDATDTRGVADAWTALERIAKSHTARLRLALADPAAAQRDLLCRILRANAGSDFAREHRLNAGLAPSAFREAVPVRTYDEMRPWVDAIAAGRTTALTGEPVIAFEETGGSSGGSKLVPYTRGALDGFAAAVLPWMADLVARHPSLASSTAYFAVSPAPRAARRTVRGIPVGLENEATYFGDAAPSIGRIAVRPDPARTPDDPEGWAIATAARLAAERDLGLISVWSPTFLARLLDAIENSHEAVARAVRDRGGRPGAVSVARLAAAMAGGTLDVGRLWPRLRVVSCWADASARAPAEALRRRLPEGVLQPKGLLATEGAFTVPLLAHGACVPALASAFLEFEDAGGTVHGADELASGEEYDLIVTTLGGLTRYRIGDRVRCDGHVAAVPTLRFVGRSGAASDLVGEKLTEAFVLSCLEDLAGVAALVPRPAPETGRKAGRAHYLVVIDAAAPPEPPRRTRIEARLRRNPQYDYARRLGQLGPLTVLAVPGLMERYVASRVAAGRRLGDVKPPAILDAGENGVWSQPSDRR